MCIDSKTKVKQIDEVISEKSSSQNQLEKQKEYISENSMEIHGEKGARILNLFCKFIKIKSSTQAQKKRKKQSPSGLESGFPDLLKQLKKSSS